MKIKQARENPHTHTHTRNPIKEERKKKKTVEKKSTKNSKNRGLLKLLVR